MIEKIGVITMDGQEKINLIKQKGNKDYSILIPFFMFMFMLLFEPTLDQFQLKSLLLQE